MEGNEANPVEVHGHEQAEVRREQGPLVFLVDLQATDSDLIKLLVAGLSS